MNFFEHQDQARRNTALLVVLFLLAVLSLIGLTYILVVGVLAYVSQAVIDNPQSLVDSFNLPTLIYIALAILAIVGLASLYKFAQLAGGGRAVAEALGGHLVNTNTRDHNERKLLNVVEEMALASGIPVPPVYVIEEQAINAFAAGHQPRDAVIGITRGCIELLNRDELQGVIAHEFSHIFNGDMRLNLNLIGILHGILVIGIIGHYVLRMVSHSSYRVRSSKNKGALPLLVLGGGLMAIGYLGTFFGNLIKAAVSRQREFLADASAVQFTRNPSGISGALQKIGGLNLGSTLQTPHAEELSHLFFGQAVKPMFNTILATHPPLEKRIKRIQPQWNGRYPSVNVALVKAAAGPVDRELPGATSIIAATLAAVAATGQDTTSLAVEEVSHTLVDSIGEPQPAHLAASARFLASLPELVTQSAHEPYGARALVYCLLLDADAGIREKQWQCLAEAADPDVYQLARQLDSPPTRSVENRLSLMDLCLPALKQLTADQYTLFKANLVKLIKADAHISINEWALFRVAVANLEPARRIPGGREIPSLKYVARATGLMLSAVAGSAANNPGQAEAAFAAGQAVTGLRRIKYVTHDQLQVKNLSRAVALLNRLKPLQKPKLLKALCASAAHDGFIQPSEVELIRALADSLDCPMPPLLAQ